MPQKHKEIRKSKDKKPLAFLLCLFIVCLGYGQNIVPNSSFEDNLTPCPFSFGLETYVQNWKSARETPDYFNSCATWSGASTPTNDYGYQEALSGNAYIGMLTYRSDSSLYTEAIGVQLSQPLEIGTKYYVSFYQNLVLENSTGSMAANNKVGVQFSTIEYSSTNEIPINNFAHVWSDLILTDTLNWVKVAGSFIADSTYSYLNLGNFFDKPFMDSVIYGETFGAYYFFDDVCVSSDSLTCNKLAGIYQNNKNEQLFNVYPTSVSDFFQIVKFPNEPYDITIFDIFGQKIYEEKNVITNNKVIDAKYFDAGLLIVNIKIKNERLNFKILKL